jgi:purine-nucleoside phosphorylase
MEAAALFAVAEHRHLEACAAFVLSDVLSELEWTPDFGSPSIQHGLSVLTNVAIELLSS